MLEDGTTYGIDSPYPDYAVVEALTVFEAPEQHQPRTTT